MVTSKHPVVGKICEALGLDPSLTHRLAITIEAGEVINVDVSTYPDESSIGDIAELLDRRFRLVEVSEERPE